MDQNSSNLFELQVDAQTHSYLSEAARWSKFLSIIGFIFCGLIAVMAIFAGSTIANSFTQLRGAGAGDAAAAGAGGLVTFIYLVIAVVYLFPCLYLFRFSTRMQVALRNNDQETLNRSFGSLKSCFKFVGILTIVMLAIWLIFLLIFVAVLGGSRF